MTSTECPACHQVSGAEAGPKCPFCGASFAQATRLKKAKSIPGLREAPTSWDGGGSDHTWEDDIQALGAARTRADSAETMGKSQAASGGAQVFLVALLVLLLAAAGIYFWMT